MSSRWKTAFFTAALITIGAFILVDAVSAVFVATKAIKIKKSVVVGSPGWRTAYVAATLLVLWAVGLATAWYFVRRREGRQLRMTQLLPISVAVAAAATFGGIPVLLLGWVLAVRYLPRTPQEAPGPDASPSPQPAKAGPSEG